MRSGIHKLKFSGSADGFPSYDLGDKKAHEAGFDSFLTGLCFASMLRYLSKYLQF